MKQRVISAIVALIIVIPLLLAGGILYNGGVVILSLIALREFLKVRQEKKELPLFINFISYIILVLIVATGVNTNNMIFTVDFKVISALIMVFLLPTVLYHDRKLYSVTDAFYLLGGVFFLGISFSLLIVYRNIDLLLLIYLVLITVTTDTYAYIIGRLIGKHKLLESISPNKTWEGMVSGTIFGTIIPTVFYVVAIGGSSIKILLITFFLSVVGQFGDLVFSAIKRYYGKKDFSNIMPGHGGILDRLDSIIFVMLGFVFFIPFL